MSGSSHGKEEKCIPGFSRESLVGGRIREPVTPQAIGEKKEVAGQKLSFEVAGAPAEATGAIQHEIPLENLDQRQSVEASLMDVLKHIGISSFYIRKTYQKGVFDIVPSPLDQLEHRDRSYRVWLNSNVETGHIEWQQIEVTRQADPPAAGVAEAPVSINPLKAPTVASANVENKHSHQNDLSGAQMHIDMTSIPQDKPVPPKLSIATQIQFEKTDTLQHGQGQSKSHMDPHRELRNVLTLQYNSFLERLGAEGFVDMDQLERLKNIGLRGLDMMRASYAGVFTGIKDPGPDLEKAFTAYIGHIFLRELISRDQQQRFLDSGLRKFISAGEDGRHGAHDLRLKLQEEIDDLQFRCYENYLLEIRAKNLITSSQLAALKGEGLQTKSRMAVWQGCFLKSQSPTVYHEKYYEYYLKSLFDRGMIRVDQLKRLTELGLSGLRTTKEYPGGPSPIDLSSVHLAGKTLESSKKEAQGQHKEPQLYTQPTFTTHPNLPPPSAQGGNDTQPAMVSAKHQDFASSVRSTQNQVNLQTTPNEKLAGTGSQPPQVESIPPFIVRENPPNPSAHGRGQGRSGLPCLSKDIDETFELLSSQPKVSIDRTQSLYNDNLQKRANGNEERMRKCNQRNIERAVFKEKKRQNKELRKIERQTRQERDEISSATGINKADQPHLSLAGSSLQTPEKSSKPEPSSNAFSMMMGSASKISSYCSAQPIDFAHHIPPFTQSLGATRPHYHPMGDRQFAEFVIQSVAAIIKSEIISKTHAKSHFQTRVNGMNTIMVIATNTAYTGGLIAGEIRNSQMPDFLINCLLHIAEGFSEAEVKRMSKERQILHNLRQLRQDPIVPWEGGTWNGLDEVLRVLNDGGPVDFRKVFRNVKSRLDVNDKLASVSISKAIRRDISDYVTYESCFETRYNALNALADIGLGLLQRSLEYPRIEATLLVETLCGSLAKIGQTLTVHEIEEIVGEFRMEEIFDSSFANLFDQLLIPDITQPISQQEYENGYSVRRQIGALLEERSTRAITEYCQSSLLMKLFFLRWKSLKLDYRWESSEKSLNMLLENLVDTSAPIQAGEYLQKITRNFAYGLVRSDVGALRESVDRSIHQILRRSSSKATVESRLNGFKILTKIGLHLVEWLDPSRPFHQTSIFQDQITEDNLTDAMRYICHSLMKDGRTKLLSDDELMTNLTALNNRRLRFPEAMMGLDATLDMINGIEDSSGSAESSTGQKKRKADDAGFKDSNPSKRFAVSRPPPRTKVPIIDLSGD